MQMRTKKRNKATNNKSRNTNRGRKGKKRRYFHVPLQDASIVFNSSAESNSTAAMNMQPTMSYSTINNFKPSHGSARRNWSEWLVTKSKTGASTSTNNAMVIHSKKGLADGQPSTSAQARASASPAQTFRKFRDKSHKRKHMRRKKNHQRKRLDNTRQSIGQIITKKLLRSIRRRQNQFTTPKNQRRYLGRKLDFIANGDNTVCEKSVQNSKKKKSGLRSLEEGEILSDNDDVTIIPGTTDRDVYDGDDDTNDCICIEPKFEEIVINDDEPSTSSFALIKENHTKLISSTPYASSKTTATNTLANNQVIMNSQTSFVVDTERIPWFDSISSTDNFSDEENTPKPGSVFKTNRNLGTALPDPDEIIVLDDTTCNENNAITDDSVVFVSEYNNASYIPLVSNKVPNPARNRRVKATTSPARPHNNAQNELFTASERKQLRAYNSNAYNPAAGTEPIAKNKKRVVLIDGSNVAYSHALNKQFSVKGIQISIEFFEKMGHEVKVVVPQFRLQMGKSSSPEELEKLHGHGKIVFTPCKNLPGKSTSSYDDRFILQLAYELDAAVISNDNYRDLLNENTAFKKIIENRVVGYTWCNDIFILPKDPYGRWGPSLQDILNRT